ncbi:MAG TPA: glycosyltransferase family 39 protein [Pseudonocardiaceae bacterium]|nr:glycosyltransferase family 39 protein [Pseudonocardiaceae bacterium]
MEDTVQSLAQPDENRLLLVEQAKPRDTEYPPTPWLARWPVLAIAGGVGLVLLLASGRVGYFADELYFLAAGRHLSWGYADQGPLAPLLARAMDSIFPGSLVAERLPVTILTAAGVFVAALIARELGGQRRAQVLTAGAYAMGMLTGGHLFTTAAIDVVMWTAATWLLVRWVRLRDDRLIIALGGLTAIALQNKLLIVALWIVAGLSVFVFGPRELLRRPALWLGASIAVVAILPNLIWQAHHGWPQLELTRVIASEPFSGGGLAFLPLALANAGILLGATLVCYGLWRLLRSSELRPYRFLGWTLLGLTTLFLITGGRFYYIQGLFPVCWAAGTVELQRHSPARWWRWVFSVPVYVLSTVVALTGLPVLPASWPTPAWPVSQASLGWPEVTETVADVYHSPSLASRHNMVVMTEWFWDAAAIDRFGPAQGIPHVYSAHRGYWYFGAPPDSADTVLFVGSDPAYLHQFFTEVHQVATITSGPAMNLFSYRTPVWLCSGQHEPWSRLWPQLRHL